MKKRNILIIAIVALVGLIIFLGVTKKAEEKEAAKQAKIEKESLPYNVEKEKLQVEMEDLEAKYQSEQKKKSTIQFLFTDIKEEMYKNCYPKMKENGFVGILALSNQQLPGKTGCITVEQFQELIKAGWTVCVKWDEKSSVNQWWPNLQKSIKDLGVQPECIYVPAGTYNTKLDSTIQKMGFSIVICGKNESQSPIQTKLEEGLWHVGGFGFMGRGAKKWLENAVAKDANVTFLIGFQKTDELYEPRNFDAMLSYCKKYEESDDAIVGGLTSAKEHYVILEKGMSTEQEAEYKKSIESLQKQIEEIDKKIEEINARYK